jgi:dienelactone hydrolase
VFDIPTTTPLDPRTHAVSSRDGARVHDVSFASAAGGRVTGHLVEPDVAGPGPAVLFLHWELGSRASFLSEALAYARAGVTSLLLDAPGAGARRGEEPLALGHAPTAQRFLRQCVSDLRRGVDLLCARPEVDAGRLAFVGHGLGASVGGALAGVEPRLRAHVLMAGHGEVSRAWGAAGDAGFTAALAPFDPVRHVVSASAAFHFQFGAHDARVPREDAERYAQAAREPRHVCWYGAGAGLNPRALRDRAVWLHGQLGFPRALTGEALARVRLPRADLLRAFLRDPGASARALLDGLTGRAPRAAPAPLTPSQIRAAPASGVGPSQHWPWD